MDFGDLNRFGVECDIYARSGVVLFGQFRLWMGGRPVCQYEQSVTLNTPASSVQVFLRYQGPRHHETLDEKDKQDVLSIVRSTVYSDMDEGEGNMRFRPYEAFSKIYKNLIICPDLCPSCDGNQAVLLEYPDHSRLMWQASREKESHEILLKPKECLEVLKAFVDWVNLEKMSEQNH